MGGGSTYRDNRTVKIEKNYPNRRFEILIKFEIRGIQKGLHHGVQHFMEDLRTLGRIKTNQPERQ